MRQSASYPPAIQDSLAATSQRVTAHTARLLPLDALRGFIMVVMALDHANDFIAHAHPPPEMWFRPLPSYPNALAFLTRFVTHLAAPGFFFLMGAGMMLFASSRRAAGWNQGAVVRHFVTRGLILIALQFLVENRAWPIGSGSPNFPLYFGVLYGLGGAMIMGAFLLRLNSVLLVGLSVSATVLTALLLPTPLNPNNPLSLLLQVLIIPGFSGNVTVYYPVLPWLALVTFGMVYGRWVLHDRAQAYRRALIAGATFVLLFFLLRLVPGFWNIRLPEGAGWIAFLNVVKYPPSLVFILLMLGTDLILLSMFARARSHLQNWGHPLIVFGSSALFFYIAHLYLYAFMGLALGGRGTGIPAMYPFWILGLVILYPLCWLYGRFKHSQPPNSLWRFF